MPNLLLITNGFPYGESERSFLSAEFEELRKQFQVHIMTPYNAGNQVIYPVPKEVQYGQYCIDSKWKRALRLPSQLFRKEVYEDLRKASKKTDSLTKRILRMVSIMAYSECADEIEHQLEEIVKTEAIGIIYTYWCTPATIAALRLKNKYSRLKVITRFHGCDLFEERTDIGWQWMRSYIAENCDQLVFASQQGQRYFLEHWGERWRGKSLVSYLGCRKMDYLEARSDDRLKIISCSNLIPLKRVELIISALAKLPENLQVEWHHLGDGISRKNCEDSAKQLLGNRNNIRYKFWGAVPNDKLENIYKEIGPDVFITVSSTEGGVPVSIAEAFAMGIPAIGTMVGGIPEIIVNKKNGFLLPSDPTTEEIVNIIMQFVRLSFEERMQIDNHAYGCWKNKYDTQKNAQQFVRYLSEQF